MKNKEIETWIEKIKDAKGSDLSKDEDLSIALMNLISLEEHFYFSAMKENNAEYLVMLNSVRNLRKNLLARIVKDPKGEEWCISKHLLAASMRLIEVGTKELGEGRTEDANLLFKSAFDLYSLFFAINLKNINVKEIVVDVEDDKTSSKFMGRISAVVKKIVDCCKE